jgi:hypothetical protein
VVFDLHSVFYPTLERALQIVRLSCPFLFLLIFFSNVQFFFQSTYVLYPLALADPTELIGQFNFDPRLNGPRSSAQLIQKGFSWLLP